VCARHNGVEISKASLSVSGYPSQPNHTEKTTLWRLLDITAPHRHRADGEQGHVSGVSDATHHTFHLLMCDDARCQWRRVCRVRPRLRRLRSRSRKTKRNKIGVKHARCVIVKVESFPHVCAQETWPPHVRHARRAPPATQKV
jgi:hypothetical protein